MQDNPFNIKVNDKFESQIQSSELADLDLVKKDAKTYHLLSNQKSFVATIQSIDMVNKVVSLKVNDELFEVNISDKYDLLVDKLGLSINISHKVNEVKAPMPGLVLNIEVQPGDVVAQGDALLVLEAMKMENVIKSLGDGVIKSINVGRGVAVEKGEILIEME